MTTIDEKIWHLQHCPLFSGGRMTQQQMESLLHRHPDMAYRVTKFSWQRIARLQQRLADIMTKLVRQRLTIQLLNLAGGYGGERDGIHSLDLTITHDDLARLVGPSREMVSKLLSVIRQLGWTHSSRKTIELLDRPALAAIAETPGA